MNIRKQKKVYALVAIATGVVSGFTVGAVALFAQWAGPPGTPPNPNAPAPINVGSSAQIKNGGLGVNQFSAFGNAYFAGTVGIGELAPTANLHVIGDVRGDRLCIGSDCRAAWPSGGGGGSPAGANTQIQFNSSGSFGADADLTWDAANNRLGIGGTSGANITVSHINPNIRLSDTDGSIFIMANNTDTFSINQPGTVGLVNIENGAPADSLRINATGNIGIGTPSPLRKLTVVGGFPGVLGLFESTDVDGALVDVHSVPSEDAAIRFQSNTNWTVGHDRSLNSFVITNANNFPSNTSDASKYFVVDTAGNVGIGNTNPQYNLDVGGVLNAGGGFIVETRTGNPSSPEDGRMWLVL